MSKKVWVAVISTQRGGATPPIPRVHICLSLWEKILSIKQDYLFIVLGSFQNIGQAVVAFQTGGSRGVGGMLGSACLGFHTLLWSRTTRPAPTSRPQVLFSLAATSCLLANLVLEQSAISDPYQRHYI